MITAMDEAGAPLFTAFCYRFSPSALRIRDLIREGAVGSVGSLRLVYNWGALGKYEETPDGRRILRPLREGRMHEGGPLVDCGTHQIDLARFWLGSEVTGFHGYGAWVDDYAAPDHVWVHMDHENGVHSTVEVSYSYHHTSRNARSEFVYEVIGTEGVIRYDRERRRLDLEDGRGRHELPFHPEKNFRGMYEAFARCLATGDGALLATAEDGLRATEIALGATEQAMFRRQTRAP